MVPTYFDCIIKRSKDINLTVLNFLIPYKDVVIIKVKSLILMGPENV